MLIKSGIIGFDDLLLGGLVKNSAILVEGVPGSGKTTLGLEFIYKGIVERNEPGIVITFEEFPEQLYRDAFNYGWDLRRLEDMNLLRVICTSPELVLDKAIGFLENIVKEISAQRLVLDSVTQFTMELNNNEVRSEVYSLCSGLKRMGLTSVLIKEVDDYGSQKATFEEYIVDTVLRLYFDESLCSRRRYIEVLKSRGQDFISGKYPLKFASKGLEIIGVPKLKDPSPAKPEFDFRKIPSGIEGLDNILGGGFLENTTSIVEGASGTGKSVIGFHYLLEGIKQGEKGLLVITEEGAHWVNQYIKSFNVDIEDINNNQDIFFIDRVFTCSCMEEVIRNIISVVEENSIQRVVVDFVNTFAEFSDNLLALKKQFRNLHNSLNMMGCTTILILNEDQVGAISPLKTTIQSLVQGEIYLSSTTRKGKQYRSLEVKKMKGQKYISGVHLVEISNAGMAVFQRIGGS